MINTKNGKLTPCVVSRRDTAVSVSGLKSSNRYGKIKRVRVFSPFLYLYSMKLLVTLKNIILNEENNKPRGTTIFSTISNDKLIQLKSTYHQRNERHGNETYKDIVDKYNDFLYTNKSKFRQPPRFAVPAVPVCAGPVPYPLPPPPEPPRPPPPTGE